MMIKPAFVFRGSENSPFLAPRGIYVHGDILVISDTAQNRVFIWKSIPNAEYQEPDIILGTQLEEVSSTTLYYPSGVWTDGVKLIVADAWNHRVLIWHQFPTSNYQPADIVVGQPDFNSNQPNVTGLNAPTTIRSTYWCYGVYSDGISLWVADTGNRRVLYYDIIPTENYHPASMVIGQPNFESKNYESEYPTWPYSVKVSSSGEMLIADTQCFRVHYWKEWKTAITSRADFLIGQPDYDHIGQNQYALKPKSNTLSWCYDAIFDFVNSHVYVADTGNSRVLQYDYPITASNISAVNVYGQKGYEEVGDHIASVMGHDDYMYWPFSIASHHEYLIACETGNNRIFFYKKTNIT